MTRRRQRTLLAALVLTGVVVLPAVLVATRNASSDERRVSGRNDELRSTGLDEPIVRILPHPRTPKIVYVTTEKGFSSVYRSTDGGRRWSQIGPDFDVLREQYGLRFADFELLALDPSRPATLYGVVDWLLLKSSDGGDTWAPLTPPRCNGPVVDQKCPRRFRGLFFGLAVDPAESNTLYAAGYQAGLLKSTDGGRSWVRQRAGLGVAPIRAVSVEPTRGGVVYAVTEIGLFFRSTNGGASWVRLAPRVDVKLGESEPPVLGGRRPWTVYVRGTGLEESDDRGRTWHTSHPDVLATHEMLALSSLAVDPRSSRTLYVSAADHVGYRTFLLRSGNAGRRWSVVARRSGTSEYAGTTLTFEPLAVDANGRVYVGTVDGLLVWERRKPLPE